MAKWLSPKSYSQWLNGQVEISNEWFPSRVYTALETMSLSTHCAEVLTMQPQQRSRNFQDLCYATIDKSAHVYSTFLHLHMSHYTMLHTRLTCYSQLPLVPWGWARVHGKTVGLRVILVTCLGKSFLKESLNHQILAKYIWWGDVPVKRFFKSIKYTANTGSLRMGSSEPQGVVPTTEFLHSDRWTQLDEIDWLEFLTKILEKSRRGSCPVTATIGRRRGLGRDPRSARKKGNTIIS